VLAWVACSGACGGQGCQRSGSGTGSWATGQGGRGGTDGGSGGGRAGGDATGSIRLDTELVRACLTVQVERPLFTLGGAALNFKAKAGFGGTLGRRLVRADIVE
jgi:hypothetical protein